ncbi:SDR family NAD(P)-dependent oxidoreductase [Paenibacillus sp. OAS669]|uniref:SDR family NAD(P)-dependent oxidoreductase n=1 Tax=Paenibacillus sp. OAS669 TaxID=2663821 RepID=UPI001789604B|nr:SDR family NAD(P)-dependent oxidoreductase [Paenibacillus sp. OAS669]MBE1446577.1 benzil reductase ((S)-benzoin forming) [Paenibacillus sp. OAS669]
MKYFIITGTSKGIGEALAGRLLAPGHCVLCVSRSVNPVLASRQGNLRYFPFDLSRSGELDGLMDEIFEFIDPADAESVYLINNAAVVGPLASIEQCSAQEITYHMQVNLLAPMILISLFIERTAGMGVDKRILNLSSASSKYLVPGMSCYSTAKAGLDTFTQAVGLEQKGKEGGVQIVSVWPGMIDTSLQEEARTTDPGRFASANLFAGIKDKGMLTTPEYTADQLIRLLLGDSFGQGTIVEQLSP